MTGLSTLWLPILLSSIIVFVASSLIHMVLGWHKNDYPPLPNEDQVLDALRPFTIPPGDYFVPRPATHAHARTPEFAEKVKKGPVMMFTVMRNEMMPMSRNLTMWFLYLIVVGIFSGYIAGRALGPGASYLEVFRFVGATAFIAYSAALWQMSIWYRRGWGLTIKATVDGLIYALLTAGTFGWLWPR